MIAGNWMMGHHYAVMGRSLTAAHTKLMAIVDNSMVVITNGYVFHQNLCNNNIL